MLSKSILFCGWRWIRTTEGVSQQIYSLPHLATLVSTLTGAITLFSGANLNTIFNLCKKKLYLPPNSYFMKKITLLSLLAILLIGFNACKKETIDVTHLLSSVPSSASGVIVLNMESLLEDAGCKIKGHEVTPGDELMKLLQNASSANQRDFMVLFDGSTGIEPKGAVVFYDTNRAFLTFALYDVNKFIQFIENESSQTFISDASGVKVCENVAVKDAQAWICLTSGKSIDPDAISSYASLNDSQSFLMTPMGEKLLVSEDDIRGWAVLRVFIDQFMSRQNRSMATLGLGFLFEDAESVKFSVEFSKGEVDMEATVLNDKGKPAKYLLPSEKIDAGELKNLGSTCDAMMAFTLNQKLIKKFDQLGAAFGGLFGDFGEKFKNIDGTVGIVASGKNGEENINGYITTKGDVSPDLRDLITRILAPVSQDGKYLRFSKGNVSGNLSVAECADELKGCCLGLVMDMSAWNYTGYGEAPADFRSLCVKFKPESGGLEMELKLKMANEKENSLLAIIKNAKYKRFNNVN